MVSEVGGIQVPKERIRVNSAEKREAQVEIDGRLRMVIGDSLEHETSQEPAGRLIDFVRDAKQHLHSGKRLP